MTENNDMERRLGDLERRHGAMDVRLRTIETTWTVDLAAMKASFAHLAEAMDDLVPRIEFGPIKTLVLVLAGSGLTIAIAALISRIFVR